jgi:hypothetical protein
MMTYLVLLSMLFGRPVSRHRRHRRRTRARSLEVLLTAPCRASISSTARSRPRVYMLISLVLTVIMFSDRHELRGPGAARRYRRISAGGRRHDDLAAARR